MYYERFSYKEEVTGSNPVAPTRVFQILPYKNSLATRIRPAFSVISYEIVITHCVIDISLKFI